MKKKSGVNLYNYARTVIPGGTTLFSKDQSFICQINGQLILQKQKK